MADKSQDDDLLERYPADEIIVREGSPGKMMYIVAEGQVELVRRFGQGDKTQVLEVGEFFGEMVVLEDGSSYDATARAISECRLLPINRAVMEFILREHPDVTLRIMRKLASRLRKVEAQEEKARRAISGVFKTNLQHEDLSAIQPVIPPEQSVPSNEPLPSPMPSLEESFEPVKGASPTESTLGRQEERSKAQGNSGRKVIFLSHVPSGTNFPVLLDRENLIGRADPQNGHFPEIDLAALDKGNHVSRLHASIACREGKFFVRQISDHGWTYLGRFKLRGGQVRELQENEVLKIGLLNLKLTLSSLGNDS